MGSSFGCWSSHVSLPLLIISWAKGTPKTRLHDFWNPKALATEEPPSWLCHLLPSFLPRALKTQRPHGWKQWTNARFYFTICLSFPLYVLGKNLNQVFKVRVTVLSLPCFVLFCFPFADFLDFNGKYPDIFSHFLIKCFLFFVFLLSDWCSWEIRIPYFL